MSYAVACIPPEDQIIIDESRTDESVRILHLAFYPEYPDEESLSLLREELSTDEELGMIGVSYNFWIVPEHLVNIHFREELEFIKEHLH